MDFLLRLLLPLLSVCLLSCSGITSGEPVRVKEGSEAVLPCSIRPEKNIAQEYFNWRKVGQKEKEVFEYDKGKIYGSQSSNQDEQFKGRVFHFPDQLQFGNASIVIRDTKLSDRGTYSCDFAKLQPNNQMFYIDLVVAACSKPSITLHDQTKDWALLQCDVLGASPKPKVEWQDSDGNILHDVKIQDTEREGRFYITLNTTVTKTGHYHCVATQLEICHQIPAKIFVYVNGPSTGWIVAVAVPWVLLVLVVVIVFLVLHNKRHITQYRERASHSPQDQDSTLKTPISQPSDPET